MTEKTTIRLIVLAHIRAVGPVGLSSIQHEVRTQYPHAYPGSHQIMDVLDDLRGRGVIRYYDGDDLAYEISR